MQLSGAPRGAPFFLGERRSDHQENDKDEPGGDAGHNRKDVPAMAPRPVDAGSAAGGYQGRVEFSRVRIRAGQSTACPLGIELERKRLGMTLGTPHGRIVPRIG